MHLSRTKYNAWRSHHEWQFTNVPYSLHQKKTQFDTEIEMGNNIGRFANQSGVLQALHAINEMSTRDKPWITEDDWRGIKHRLDEQCNAPFHTIAHQLVLKVARYTFL